MPLIELVTIIHADIAICFDLARSIDLHEISTAKTNEKAIDGRTRGLIKLNEFVTWEATHFGMKQRLTSKITAYERPFHFRDEQLKGAFKSMIHDHYFETRDDKTIMKDHFNYESPFGIAGRIFDKLILTNYLRNLLTKRNSIIKEFAETEKWESILNKKINNKDTDLHQGDFDYNGELTYNYKGIPFTGIIETYENNKLVAALEYEDGLRNGLQRIYYDNGQLEEE